MEGDLNQSVCDGCEAVDLWASAQKKKKRRGKLKYLIIFKVLAIYCPRARR
jgi:hypothetical protein